MITRAEIRPIGKFHKTHALHGELNAVLDIDADFLDMEHPLIVDVDGIYVPFYCESVRPKGHFSSLVKLQGVDSEEAAREFVNKEIFALKADLEAYEDEEEHEEGGYADDFIGYKIVDTETGRDIGEIRDIDLSTANTLFIVEGGDGKIYIPVAEEYIDAIDDDVKTISMTLPEGLIDINT